LQSLFAFPKNKLTLAKRFTPVVHPGGAVLLMSEDGAIDLRGQIYVDLVQALAEGVTWKHLEHRLAKMYPREELLSAIRRFVEGGLIGASTASPRAEGAFWESAGLTADAGPVAVVNFCGPRAEVILHTLKANGLVLRRQAPRALAITDDYLRPELDRFSKPGLEWLLVKPVGHTIWIGPLFGMKESVCWWCLAHWLRTNRWCQCAFAGSGVHSFPQQPPVAALPGTLALAAGMVSTVVTLWIARGDYPELRNRIITLDSRDLRLTRHVVHQLPGCPHCCADKSQSGPPTTMREWVSPLTGIVPHLEITQGPVFGFFLVRATQMQPLPTPPGSRDLLQPSWVWGRGITPAAAETSCLGEAIERYSSVYQGNEHSTGATLAQVDGISPNQILLFSGTQYDGRESWNATHSLAHWVPERLDSSQSIQWTEARSVLTGATKYVPSGCCYLRYPFRDQPEYASADSNGCAAGRSLEDAILGGLLELVERDAVAIWWYNRLGKPAVDLASFGEPFLLLVREQFAAEGRDLYLLDVTNDLETPVYVAVAPRRDGSELVFGSAAHPDSSEAARKAVGELAQTLYWDTRLSSPNELRRWLTAATLEDHGYFKPIGEVKSPRMRPPRTVEDAIQQCTERLQAAGIETYFVDLTRPEIRIPVVRVIAPGLRHFWARLAPGRLYQVPYRMGWLNKPHREQDLNPLVCMV
jgi:bacteriocin biosynthesis cyclodehydratase domain-containing protein